LISIRPGPYSVAAATSSFVINVLLVQLTNAVIVNPFANLAADSNGKLAMKYNILVMDVAVEIRTETGRF